MLIRRMLRPAAPGLSADRPAADAAGRAGEHLVLRFGGGRYATADWTPGGVRLASRGAALAPDRPVEGEIEGFGLRGRFEAHVSHVDGDGAFLRFDSVPTTLFLEMMRARGA